MDSQRSMTQQISVSPRTASSTVMEPRVAFVPDQSPGFAWHVPSGKVLQDTSLAHT